MVQLAVLRARGGGGIFGLFGGYLTDLLGRRRVLTWSILLYAFAAFAAGFSTSLPMLLFFRAWSSSACAWNSSRPSRGWRNCSTIRRNAKVCWDSRRRFRRSAGCRSRFAAIITAAWSQGAAPKILFGMITLPAIKLPAIHLPSFLSFLGEVQVHNADWRYLLMSGLIPAIPLLIIRPFLPESPNGSRSASPASCVGRALPSCSRRSCGRRRS